jgi:hypothetical protein
MSTNPYASETSRKFFGMGFFGLDEFPDANYYEFVSHAVFAAALAAMLYWLASFVADLVRYYAGDDTFKWENVWIRALALSIYSFTSTFLIYLVIR